MFSTPCSSGVGVTHDQIHPTIISDMRTFENFNPTGSATDTPPVPTALDFNFDLSKAFPLPQESQLAQELNNFQDIQSYFDDAFLSPSIIAPAPAAAAATATSTSAAATSLPAFLTPPDMPPELDTLPPQGGNTSVPVLDATWQSFVEQLGF